VYLVLQAPGGAELQQSATIVTPNTERWHGGIGRVPLSEHEQRMLRQIERQFQQEKGLARPLRMPVDPREARRNAKRASLGFVIGLLALLISFASSWVIGVIGFFAMLASAVVLVQSMRRLAQEHWGQGGPPGGPAGEPEAHGGRPGRPAGGKWWSGWGGTPGRGDDDDSF
jgi:hypothetical protein